MTIGSLFQEAFFSEPPIHTSRSFDAVQDRATLDPNSAHRFAPSEEVEVSDQG